MTDDKEKKRQFGTYLRYLVAILLAGATGAYCGARELARTICSIPSCPDCTLAVSANLSSTANGSMGSYSCNAMRSVMLLDGSTEVLVKTPVSNATYSDTPGLPFKPANAQLCFYYYVPPTGVRKCGVAFNVK
jgi:hypothetical protein